MTNVFPSWHKPNLVLLVLRWGGCGYFWLVQILEKSWQGLLPWSPSKSKDVDGKSNGWNFQFNPHLPSSLWMLRASVVPSIYAAPAFVQCLTFVAFPDPPYGTESQLLSELTLDSRLMGCGFRCPPACAHEWRQNPFWGCIHGVGKLHVYIPFDLQIPGMELPRWYSLWWNKVLNGEGLPNWPKSKHKHGPWRNRGRQSPDPFIAYV